MAECGLETIGTAFLLLIFTPMNMFCKILVGYTLTLAFWNLENFFDWKDDGQGESDREFSSNGPRHWTKSRFYTKAGAVAKAVGMLGEDGQVPDVVGFAEVENKFVISSIAGATFLRKYGYGIVHYDSPDPRGIDCALIYRKAKFSAVESFPYPVRAGRPTRDILVVKMVTHQGDSLVVMINHHPSKYGGRQSDTRRLEAVNALKELSDSLCGAGWRNQAALGDFNDVPSSPVYEPLKASLRSLSEALERDGEGSIRFDGKWELIDQCWVRGFEDAHSETKVVHIPQLEVRDSPHAGRKPLRTYSGPRYLGGVSDHCPIVLNLDF